MSSAFALGGAVLHQSSGAERCISAGTPPVCPDSRLGDNPSKWVAVDRSWQSRLLSGSDVIVELTQSRKLRVVKEGVTFVKAHPCEVLSPTPASQRILGANPVSAVTLVQNEKTAFGRSALTLLEAE